MLAALVTIAYATVGAIALMRVGAVEPWSPYHAYRIWIVIGGVVPLLTTRGEIGVGAWTDGLSCAAFLSSLIVLDAVLFSRVRARPASRRDNSPPTPVSDSRFSGAPAGYFLAVYLGGWGWRWYAVANDLLHGTLLAPQLELTVWSNAIAVLNGIGGVALAGYAVFARRWWPLIVLLPCELAWLFVGGSKVAIMYASLPVAVIALERGRLAPRLRYITLIPVLVAILVVSFGATHQYRRVAARAVVHGAWDIGTVATETATALVEVDLWAEGARGLSERLDLSANLRELLEATRTGRVHPWWGRSYAPLLSWPVPRAIWPGKPRSSVGHWFGAEVLGWSFASRSEAAITVWGDSFMNGHVPGLLLLPGLWMAVACWFFSWGVRGGGWGLLLVAASYPRLILGLEQNPAAPTVAILQTAILVGGLWGLWQLATRLRV